MNSSKVRLHIHVAGTESEGVIKRAYFLVEGSPQAKHIVAEQDGEGWLERFAQACYDRGRSDERMEKVSDEVQG